MKDIWFISDTHFCHENIIGLAGRPFKLVEEMHSCIIENWCKSVKPNDLVYHLGDVAFKTTEKKLEIEKILYNLPGRKRLLLGNHDQFTTSSPQQLKLQDYFESIALWKVFYRENFFCSHVPIHKSEFRDTRFQVHGHLHDKQVDDIDYINVSVEQTGYCPVHMDVILETIKKRS